MNLEKFKIKSPKLYPQKCMICKTYNNNTLFEYNYYETFPDGTFFQQNNNYTLCKKCYFIYRNPTVSQKSRNKVYQKAIIDDPNKKIKKNLRLDDHENMFKSFIKQDFLKKNSKVLEIGCGNGSLLDRISKYYSISYKNIYATELSKPLLKFLKKKKYNISSNLNELLKDNFFKIIILDNVFEHLSNPLAELKKLKKHLKDDGVIYCSIPNILKTRSNISDPFNHEFNYLYNNFKHIVMSSGLKIKKIKYQKFWMNSVLEKSTKFQSKDYFVNKSTLKEINLVKKFLDKNDKNKRKILMKIKKLSKKKVFFFGAGNHTLSLIDSIKHLPIDIMGIIDNNKSYHNKLRFGNKIICPKTINKKKFDKIIISSRAFQKEIYMQLIDLGIEKEKILKLY